MNKITFTSFSEQGSRRTNEDYCLYVSNPDDGRYLFIVCDGMGGHAMGEVASQVVATTICEYWEQASFADGVEPVLQTAFHLASGALDAKADALHKVEMGTTMVLAAIYNDKITIAHCGDSRCYLLRPNVGIVYRTEDHIEQSVWGDYINRSFFSYHRQNANVEIRQFDLQPGDRVFLCTDGVSSYVYPDILRDRLMDDKSPEEVADVVKFLCEKSNTPDNYSGILVFNE